MNEIGDDGAAALAQALTENTALTHLSISHFGEGGFNSFAFCLPFMSGLKDLVLRNVTGLSKQDTAAFLKGLERNTELETTVLLNMKDDPATKALCKEMMAKMPVSFPVLYDTKNQVSAMMGVDAMPTTILIDRNGNKRFLHRGYKPGYELDYEKQIRLLVRE